MNVLTRKRAYLEIDNKLRDRYKIQVIRSKSPTMLDVTDYLIRNWTEKEEKKFISTINTEEAMV